MSTNTVSAALQKVRSRARGALKRLIVCAALKGWMAYPMATRAVSKYLRDA